MNKEPEVPQDMIKNSQQNLLGPNSHYETEASGIHHVQNALQLKQLHHISTSDYYALIFPLNQKLQLLQYWHPLQPDH